MSITTLMTADQLLRMPRDGCRYELAAGELKRMSPAGWRHDTIAGRLLGWLARQAEANDLGRLFGTDTGFLISRDPDTVRAPDVAFIRKDHLPAKDPEEAFWPGPPDLAVEVVSPGDTVSEVDDKVRVWLDAGAMMVWVVNPRWQTVTVYRSSSDIKLLTRDDELSGADVVAGFRCRVGDIFG